MATQMMIIIQILGTNSILTIQLMMKAKMTSIFDLPILNPLIQEIS